MTKTFDAIVIGGGSAGVAFAKEAAGLGASVGLFERDKLGGTCVNRGCVPKKMMWTVADTLQDTANLAAEGIIKCPAQLDMAALVKRRDARIADIVQSYQDQLDEAGVTHIEGTAALHAGGRVSVGDESYRSERIILATGAHPAPLEIGGANLMATSDDVFGWTEVPARLVVIGGGYIGTEMAGIFRAYGSDVTLVAHGARVLSEFSEGSQKIATENLKKAGVTLMPETEPTSVVRRGDALHVTLKDGNTLIADRVLNATGRDPNLGFFDGIELPERADHGPLKVGDHFRTSAHGIYAVGDIADRLPLTPVAREDGKVLTQQLFGDADVVPVDLAYVATFAFVFPPVREVGDIDSIDEITTFTAMEAMLDNSGLAEGWALHRDDSDALGGVVVIGHAAAEVVSWAAQAVLAGTTRETMRRAVSVHPSKAEEPLGSEG